MCASVWRFKKNCSINLYYNYNINIWIDIKAIAAFFSEGNKLQLLCLHFCTWSFSGVKKFIKQEGGEELSFFLNCAVKKVCDNVMLT